VPAFYTRTSVGTLLADGKEARAFDGETYVLERAIRGDVALVEAWEADRWGNLSYRASGGNFNGVMAMAADLTIAQSQHVRELGQLDPERIHTAGIFVSRVVHVPCGDPPE
jgi:3-oxoadipate CoA-transferase, alpha subunit